MALQSQQGKDRQYRMLAVVFFLCDHMLVKEHRIKVERVKHEQRVICDFRKVYMGVPSPNNDHNPLYLSHFSFFYCLDQAISLLFK